MDEDWGCFDELFREASLEEGNDWGWSTIHDPKCHKVRVTKSGEAICIWPTDGGVLVLLRDGTWVGDLAPFSD